MFEFEQNSQNLFEHRRLDSARNSTQCNSLHQNSFLRHRRRPYMGKRVKCVNACLWCRWLFIFFHICLRSKTFPFAINGMNTMMTTFDVALSMQSARACAPGFHTHTIYIIHSESFAVIFFFRLIFLPCFLLSSRLRMRDVSRCSNECVLFFFFLHNVSALAFSFVSLRFVHPFRF